jgi:hypothetical protein
MSLIPGPNSDTSTTIGEACGKGGGGVPRRRRTHRRRPFLFGESLPCAQSRRAAGAASPLRLWNLARGRRPALHLRPNGGQPRQSPGVKEREQKRSRAHALGRPQRLAGQIESHLRPGQRFPAGQSQHARSRIHPTPVNRLLSDNPITPHQQAGFTRFVLFFGFV